MLDRSQPPSCLVASHTRDRVGTTPAWSNCKRKKSLLNRQTKRRFLQCSPPYRGYGGEHPLPSTCRGAGMQRETSMPRSRSHERHVSPKASITLVTVGTRDRPDRGFLSSGSSLRGGLSHDSPICRVRSRGRRDTMFQDAAPPILRAGSWALTVMSPSTSQTVGPARGAVTLSSDGDTIDVEIRQGGSQVHERGPGTRNLDAPRVWVLTMASWLDYKGKSARQGF